MSRFNLVYNKRQFRVKKRLGLFREIWFSQKGSVCVAMHAMFTYISCSVTVGPGTDSSIFRSNQYETCQNECEIDRDLHLIRIGFGRRFTTVLEIYLSRRNNAIFSECTVAPPKISSRLSPTFIYLLCRYRISRNLLMQTDIVCGEIGLHVVRKLSFFDDKFPALSRSEKKIRALERNARFTRSGMYWKRRCGGRVCDEKRF